MAELQHRPIRPARDGENNLQERVFLEAWITRANLEGFWFGQMDHLTFLHACARVTGCEDVTQRHATVAASFFRWLGTAIGQSFVSELIRCSDSSPSHDGEVGATLWFQYNSFVLMRNKGRLPLALSILAKETQTPDQARLTLEDWRLLELLSSWLSTTDGRMFLRGVDDLVATKKRKLKVD